MMTTVATAVAARIDQGQQTDWQGKPERTWQSRYPVGEPFETEQGNQTQVYVEVTSSHSKDSKVYHSRATWVMVDRRVSKVAGREGTPFSVTRWSSNHAYVQIEREPVARYSAKALAEFHTKCVQSFEDNVDFNQVARIFEQAEAAVPA